MTVIQIPRRNAPMPAWTRTTKRTPVTGDHAWEGVIAYEQSLTADGGYLMPDSLHWESLPVPVLDGHGPQAEVIGSVEKIRREGTALIASGTLTREPAELTVSVDLDDVAVQIVPGTDMDQARDDGDVLATTDARIIALAVSDSPAFEGTVIGPVETTLTAALTGDTGLPVADRTVEWDGGEARRRVFEAFTMDDGTINTEQVSRAFLWRNDDTDPQNMGSYRLGFADIIDDQLMIIPRGVAATAGGRGVDATDLPGTDKERIKSRICSLYDTVRDQIDDWPSCPFAETAALTAAVAPVEPPSQWFDDPQLTEPTALTVTPDGQVYGHLATWGTCHTGYRGECVQAPSSASGYAYFETGSVLTADGTERRVGTLTVDTSHAHSRATASATMSHYDHTGTAVAYVSSGEDAHGIWVAGTLKASATPEQVQVLRASPLSGDWRMMGGNLELVAALAVNTPGFPVPRPRAMVASGQVVSLIAAGILPPGEVIPPWAEGGLTLDDMKYLKRLADRERAATVVSDDDGRLSRLASLAASINKEN